MKRVALGTAVVLLLLTMLAGCGNKEANPSEITYSLTMAVEGNGTTSPAVGDHAYLEGTVLTISATPDAGWQFNSWTGDVADPSYATTTVTVDTPKAVIANFAPATYYELTTMVGGDGTGTVSLDPPGGTYIAGTTVTVTATPASGSSFDRWLGQIPPEADWSNPTIEIVMNSAKELTALFTCL